MTDEIDVQDSELETEDSSSESEQTTDVNDVTEDVTSDSDAEGGRANERIRELIAERNQLREELDYANQGQQQEFVPDSQQPITYDHIRQAVREETDLVYQAKEAEKQHPELREDKVFADAVLGAWSKNKEGKTMAEIASTLKERLGDVAKEEGQKSTLKDIAQNANVAVGKASKSSTSHQQLSREIIANMSDEEFDRRHDEIQKAMASGELT
jgi:hypothetical protein